MADRFVGGRLLVASPALRDPNFSRTVVLVLEHDEDGAIGVVLNRPTETGLVEALPQWAQFAALPPVVFAGGPVAPSVGVCLARGRAAVDAQSTPGFAPLHGRLGTVDLGRDPAELAAVVDEIRVFAGYAGWGAGQLEAELSAGGWYVLDALPGDTFWGQPQTLWPAVLRRQGGSLALLATFPTDPTMN